MCERASSPGLLSIAAAYSSLVHVHNAPCRALLDRSLEHDPRSLTESTGALAYFVLIHLHSLLYARAVLRV